MDKKQVSFPFYWLILFLLFICIGFLPDLLICLTSPGEKVYRGGLINTDDISVYYSAIRQGEQGDWLFTSQFSPEAIPLQVAYLPFFLMGKLQALIGGSTAFWYQALRVISIISAGLALKTLIVTFFPNKPRHQKTAGALVLYGSGIGWLVSMLSGMASPLTPDLFLPEWNLTKAFLSSPHFVLGIAGQGLFFSKVIKGFQYPSCNNIIGGLLAALLIGGTYPFLAPVNGLILALFYLISIIKTRRVPWKKIGVTLLQSVPLLVCLWYYGVMLPQDALWRQAMLLNNVVEPPPILGILVGFGILSLLGLLSLFDKTENYESRRILLLSWFVGNLISLYLPVSFAGRLVLGLFLPVVLLAVAGLENFLLPKYPRPRQNTIRRIVVNLTMLSTIFLMLWSAQTRLGNHNYPFYYPLTEMNAVEYLAEVTTADDTVLAVYTIGNYLPRVSEANVFAGHLNLTIDLETKLDLINKFYEPETSIGWREDFLRDWGITFVFLGDFESNQYTEQITIPGKIIYQEEGITIYKTD